MKINLLTGIILREHRTVFVTISLIFAFSWFTQLCMMTKLHLRTQIDEVIIDANNMKNPMIPLEQAVGYEVPLACSECMKMMTKYLKLCQNEEAKASITVMTFRAFCETNENQNIYQIIPAKCFILNEKISAISGESGIDMIDPDKPNDLCIKFRNECDKNGGPPQCFSGFCESLAECVDCPVAVVDKNKNGNYEVEVCGLAGVCKMGWKNPKAKGGNGYCECKPGMRGLACNEY